MTKKSRPIIVCHCIRWDKTYTSNIGFVYTVIVLENLSARIYHHKFHNRVVRKRLTQKVLNTLLRGTSLRSWLSVDEFTFDAVTESLKEMGIIPTSIYKLNINENESTCLQ